MYTSKMFKTHCSSKIPETKFLAKTRVALYLYRESCIRLYCGDCIRKQFMSRNISETTTFQ